MLALGGCTKTLKKKEWRMVQLPAGLKYLNKRGLVLISKKLMVGSSNWPESTPHKPINFRIKSYSKQKI
jgi:hypothetical protein